MAQTAHLRPGSVAGEQIGSRPHVAGGFPTRLESRDTLGMRMYSLSAGVMRASQRSLTNCLI